MQLRESDDVIKRAHLSRKTEQRAAGYRSGKVAGAVLLPPFPKEDEAIHQYPRADARWCQQLLLTGLEPQVESVASLVFNSTVVPEAKLRFNTFLSARVAGPVGAPRGRSYSVGLRMRWRHQKSARQQAARGQQAAAPTDH